MRETHTPGGVPAPTGDSLLPLLATAERGYTPRELVKLLRVNADRVRGWIRAGELGAINTATTRCGKPRFVILPRHLEEFVRNRRANATPAKPVPRRKRRDLIDYYPD